MPPGTAEVRHVHRKSRQFFFVLSGEAVIEAGGARVVLRAHDGLEVEPGVAHQMRNDSAGDCEFLVVSLPPSHDDRVAVSPEVATPGWKHDA